MKTLRRWIAMGVTGAALLGSAGVADACGGCFAPPQTVQVVTDHRMILSLSATQTTLWDQFRYTGRAAEFSWILPIRYTERARIAVATNEFMQLVDGLSAPQVFAPNRPTASCGGRGLFGATASEDSSNAADAGVQVLREQVVGPYQTTVIRGADPQAIRTWLRDNGYTVPAALDPIIEFYTGAQMDYLALRLSPGEGIDRMVPVRVTLEGYQPSLPLRMISAGIADKVGLSLVVFATGRIEAMNFPNAEVREADLVWDWNAPGSPARDFLNAFERINRANGNRVWLTESSTDFDRNSLENSARFGPQPDAAPDAGMPQTTPVDDVAVAFEGLGPTARVTRLRANLEGRMLDRDLQLAASTLGARDRTYRYGVVRNTPPAPSCPGDVAFSDGTIRCSARPGPAGRAGWGLGLALGALGLAWVRRRR